MELNVLIPLAAFLLMVVLFAIVVRRTERVIADSREAELFRRSIQDLATRIDSSLGPIVERVDAVRRHLLPPAEIGENLAAALDAVQRYGEEAHALDGPASAATLKIAFEAELERADRALRMVEHGCEVLAEAHGIGTDVEGETAVKRGYLNLLHSREAIAAYATAIVETRPGTEPRWYSRRRRT